MSSGGALISRAELFRSFGGRAINKSRFIDFTVYRGQAENPGSEDLAPDFLPRLRLKALDVRSFNCQTFNFQLPTRPQPT